jgi:hypothetical protein
MDASSSVAISESFSTSLQCILFNKLKVRFVSHIIDDFIFIGAPSSNECHSALDAFLDAFKIYRHSYQT